MVTLDTLILTTLGPKRAADIVEPTLVFCIDDETNEPLVDWYTPMYYKRSKVIVITFDSGLELRIDPWTDWLDNNGRKRKCMFAAVGDRISAFRLDYLSDNKKVQIARNKRNSTKKFSGNPARMVAKALGLDIENKSIIIKDRNFLNLNPDNFMIVERYTAQMYDPNNNWEKYVREDNHVITDIKTPEEEEEVAFGRTPIGNMVIADPTPVGKAIYSGVMIGTD